MEFIFTAVSSDVNEGVLDELDSVEFCFTGISLVTSPTFTGVSPVEFNFTGVSPVEFNFTGVNPVVVDGVLETLDIVELIFTGISPVEFIFTGVNPVVIDGVLETLD